MADVVPVHYRPPDAYGLDIELVDAPELRARVASDPQRECERIDFQCFIGWMLIVNGHLVSDDMRELPAHVRLDRELAGAVTELFDRMEADARLLVDRPRLVQLLALQTAVLVGRLALGVSAATTNQLVDPTSLSRYRHNRAAVDDEYRRWHLVATYAHTRSDQPAARLRRGNELREVLPPRDWNDTDSVPGLGPRAQLTGKA